jgi:O-antigen/teichoic acid export membrane protein
MTGLEPRSAPDSIARGAAIAVAMRWTDRLIGLASTLVLARLLVPADFGIVAMASLVVLLIDTVLDLGVNAALVQNRDAGRADFDTAWTLRLLQSLSAGVLIAIAGAPLAADYFGDERVRAVLWVMALSVACGGLENIGIVALQKNMEFGREFRFTFLRRLGGFAVTIALALWLRSYWAMVVGALAGRVLGVVLSYALHAYRPRWSLARIRTLWSFSQWMLVRNIGAWGAQQIDKGAVGRRAGASTLGAYSLADDIAALPTTELLAPIGRALFPAFVRVAGDPEQLVAAFRRAFGVQALLALPAGVGLALVADRVVPLLLGPQWMLAVPLLQTLALISVATALSHCGVYLLLALGRVRALALVTWMQLGLLAALIAFAYPSAGAQGIGEIRLAVAVVSVGAFLGVVLHAVPALRWGDILHGAWRPAVGCAAMAATLTHVEIAISASGPGFGTQALGLVLAVLLGAVAFAATLAVLRFVTGHWGAGEREILDRIFVRRSDTTVTIHDSIADLPEPARALMTRCGDTALEATPGWFDLLQRTVFPGDRGVRFAVAWHGSRAVAVLPLRCAHGFPVRRIEVLANFYTAVYVPSLDPSATADDLALLLRAVCVEAPPAHALRFAPMDPDGPAFRLLERAVQRAGYVPFRFFCFGNWRQPIDCDWSTYLAARPGEVRSTIRRKGARFAAAGGTLEIVSDGAGLDAAIGDFVGVYSVSWKIPEPYPEFMPELMRLLAAEGALRLGVARLNGQAIAAQVWIVHGRRASIFKLAHREDSAEHGAGTLLTARLMAHAIDVDGVVEIDYLIGDDDYKRNWMNTRRERWGLVAYDPRSAVGLALLLREFAGRIRKRLG